MTIPTALSAGNRGVRLCLSSWKSNNPSLSIGNGKSYTPISINPILQLPVSLSSKSSNTTSLSPQSPDTFLSIIANSIPAVLDIFVGVLGMIALFVLGGHVGASAKFKKSS
jgi:hypothetical protein